jgi:hypothetical protein
LYNCLKTGGVRVREKIIITISDIFKIFISICIFIGTCFSLRGFSKIYLSLFSELIVENSIFNNFSKIDLLSGFNTAFFVGIMLLIFFAFSVIILLVLQAIKFLTKNQMDKIAIFLQKLIAASYPTLILASALDESTFSLVTNVISFFVIFSFVFKYDRFN